MKTSELLAWLLCLLIAFCAAVLAVYNATKLAVLEQRFEEVNTTAAEQTAVLQDIRDLLRRQGGELQPGPE